LAEEVKYETPKPESVCKVILESPTPCAYPKVIFRLCLPTGQLVVTENGLKPIQDVEVGEKVLTHMGRFRRVLNKHSREYEGEICWIRTFGSTVPLLLTPDHPVLACNIVRPAVEGSNKLLMQSIQWIQAKDLSKEMFLAYPAISEVEDRSTVEVSFRRRSKLMDGWTVTYQKEFELGEDLLSIIGYWLAEGNVFQSRGKVSALVFNFGDDLREYFYAMDVVGKACRLGLTAAIKRIYRPPYQNSHLVYVYSTPFANWILENFGKGASGKKIPSWILKLPAEKLRYLFDSYIRGDGYVEPSRPEIGYHGGIKVSTVSPQLAVGIRDIALKLGYRVSVAVRKGTEDVIQGRIVKVKPLFELKLNEYQKRTDSRIYKDEKFIYLRPREISKIHYKGLVWNLEVEEDNSFCTFYHTVHNCHAWYAVKSRPEEKSMRQIFVEGLREAEEIWGEKCERRTE
jgi:intein/homing endonuclease